MKRSSISKICNTKIDIYAKIKYFIEIKSTDIRSTFTKLRIYIKCTWDSKIHSFWYQNVTSNISYVHYKCNQVQNVEHILLHCKHSVLTENREMFNKIY